MSITLLWRTGLIGGTENDLDGKPVGQINDNDSALVLSPTGFFLFMYDASSSLVASPPYIINPADNIGDGRWIRKPLSNNSPRTITNNDSVSDFDSVILIDATSGNIQLTLLPAAYANALTVIRIDDPIVTGNSVNLVPQTGESIDFKNVDEMYALELYKESKTIISDGGSNHIFV